MIGSWPPDTPSTSSLGDREETSMSVHVHPVLHRDVDDLSSRLQQSEARYRTVEQQLLSNHALMESLEQRLLSVVAINDNLESDRNQRKLQILSLRSELDALRSSKDDELTALREELKKKRAVIGKLQVELAKRLTHGAPKCVDKQDVHVQTELEDRDTQPENKKPQAVESDKENAGMIHRKRKRKPVMANLETKRARPERMTHSKRKHVKTENVCEEEEDDPCRASLNEKDRVVSGIQIDAKGIHSPPDQGGTDRAEDPAAPVREVTDCSMSGSKSRRIRRTRGQQPGMYRVAASDLNQSTCDLVAEMVTSVLPAARARSRRRGLLTHVN